MSIQASTPYTNFSQDFWALVSTFSERIGYHFKPDAAPQVYAVDQLKTVCDRITTNKCPVKLPDASHLPKSIWPIENERRLSVPIELGAADREALSKARGGVGWATFVHQIANGCRHAVAFSPTSVENLLPSVSDYLIYRCSVLEQVKPKLQTAKQGKQMYQQSLKGMKHACQPSMNKQKQDKKQVAYLTATICNLLDKHIGQDGYVADPRQLPKYT